MRFFLLETGGFFLLETGGKFILEPMGKQPSVINLIGTDVAVISEG